MAVQQRLPLFNILDSRGGSKDIKLQNCFVDIVGDRETTQKIYVRKRSGSSVLHTHTAGDGRGLYYSDILSKYLYVIDDTLYNEGSAVTGTIVDGNDKVNMIDGPDNKVLITRDIGGTGDAYVYNGTTLTTISDADYPAVTVGPFATLDGYVFIMDNTKKIWNSDLDAPTSWASTSNIQANEFDDRAVGVWRY